MSLIVNSLVQIGKIDLADYLNQKDKFGESRQELKFLVPKKLLPEIIDFLSNSYRLCLSDNAQMSHFYLSKYFDTSDLRFFNMHRQGKYNRLKVRIREYKNQANRKFVECKRKVKGSQTLKDRVQLYSESLVFDHTRIQSRLKMYDLNTDELEEKIQIGYNRLIFIEKNFKARISIDFNIEAAEVGGRKISLLPGHCILEIKSDHLPKNEVKFLRGLGIRSESFSKYCVAICMLKDHVKSNKWKQVLKLC